MSTLPTFTSDRDALKFAAHFLTELEDRVSREGSGMNLTTQRFACRGMWLDYRDARETLARYLSSE